MIPWDLRTVSRALLRLAEGEAARLEEQIKEFEKLRLE
jgi:hypothetical protein